MQFDEDGNLRGPGLIKFARKNYPVIAQHNDVIIAQVFNLIRWTSGNNFNNFSVYYFGRKISTTI